MYLKLTHTAVARTAISLGVVGMLAGCVDKSYDLSDLDTTMEVKVKDLVLPVNMSAVKLSSVVNLDDQKDVIVDDDGNYVFISTGEFSSGDLEINPIVAHARLDDDESQTTVALPGAVAGTPLPIASDVYVPFTYKYEAQDPYITYVKEGDVDFDIIVTVTAHSRNRGLRGYFENIEFTLPRNMSGTVDGRQVEGNTVTFPRADLDGNGRFSFVYHVDKIYCDNENAYMNIDPATGLGRFVLTNAIGLEQGGTVTLDGNGIIDDVELQFEVDLGTLYVNSFEGTISYAFDVLEDQSVALTDLPEVLTDPNTHIALKNPQIYLAINPVLTEHHYELAATTGLAITQIRPSEDDFLPESDRTAFATGLGLNTFDSHQLYCLAERVPDSYYMENATFHRIANLGGILMGRGLPEELNIHFDNPHTVPDMPVQNFTLGRPVGEIKGTYTFYAPLDMEAGSQIVYSADQTGWNLGADNDLSLTVLQISANVRNDLPVAIELSADPIDYSGQLITDGVSRVRITNGMVAAESSTALTIAFEGEISRIDGIRYTARVLAPAGSNGAALNENQSIELTDIKARLSGSYLIDDDDDDDNDEDYQ